MLRQTTARRALTAAMVSVLALLWPQAAPATTPGPQPGPDRADQVLTWTADDSVTRYRTAPATATAGAATIVFENSLATGNTTGMAHTLTFDTSTPGYNHDVSLNIIASPFDANGGRHQAQVTLTPGTYRYFCAIPGHGQMVGELVVTGGGGDTTAPTASARVAGERDATGAYIGSATVTVTAEDAQSGVASIEYEVDDTGFRPYTAPVTVTAPGDHAVQYRATDTAGNVSETGSVAFTVVEPAEEDTTAPTVTAVVSGNRDATGAYIGTATVTVTAEDAQSGVASVEYQLDGGSWTAYTAPVAVTAPGEHTARYRATDAAGNTSAAGSTAFRVVDPTPVDTTPPTVSAVVTGERDASGAYVDTALVTLSAEDAQSGVGRIEYSLDHAPYTAYAEPVLVDAEGAHMVHFRATDRAGNTSAAAMVSFTVVAPPNEDTTPPTITAAVSGDRDTGGAYLGSATVTVRAEDTGSGVDKVEYALDGGAFAPYTAPVVVNAPGAHSVRFRATDLAGNASQAGSVSFTVVEPAEQDTTPPTATAAVSGERDAAGAYVDSATVTVTAEDAHSGVASVEHEVDGGGWVPHTGPVLIGDAGTHTVRYRATDRAGNASAVASVTFTVVERDSDPCPDSDTRATVVIGDEDTGVANADTGRGCTINDLIDETADYANHGAFVAHVDRVTGRLVTDGVLTAKDKARIVRAAARSDIGR